MSRKPPTVYFSFRSPYSWLALERLSELDLRQSFIFIPLWDPGDALHAVLTERGAKLPYTQMSRAKHLYILQDVKRLAANSGKTFVWPVDRDPEWDLPHLAWLACRDLGTQWTFYDRMIELRWGAGADICTESTIREAMDASGLAGQTLDTLRARDDIKDAALSALQDIYDNDIFGIPYFKTGHQRFWGLDRLDAFLQHMDVDLPVSPISTIPPTVRDSVGSYDRDTAGGCG